MRFHSLPFDSDLSSTSLTKLHPIGRQSRLHRQETVGQLRASATVLKAQQQTAGESAEPRPVAPRPLRLSDPGGGAASREPSTAAAGSSHAARRSLVQSLRTLSDDEEYAAGAAGCFWGSSSSDRSSDDGLLALAGASTQGVVSGALSEAPPRCEYLRQAGGQGLSVRQ